MWACRRGVYKNTIRKSIMVFLYDCYICKSAKAETMNSANKSSYFLSHFGALRSRAESLNISFIIASGRSLSPQASKFCL